VAVLAAEPWLVIQGRNPGRPAAVHGLVQRRPLFDRLSGAGPGEVVVVCAPPGSGKTALLRSWLESGAPAGPVAWMSVDRGERDAQRFWLAMVDAVAAAAGTDGRVERIAATPTFAGEVVVEHLLAGLRALGGPIVLIIDD